MRDGSDNKLLPAVVNYHVENGKREKREVKGMKQSKQEQVICQM